MNVNKTNKTRVAVYIRIGGAGENVNAFETQKAYFANAVSKNPEWELAGFYADLGADSRGQPNLARLIADCKAGRIDLVVTKSSARISRSMNSLMGVVRELAYLKPPVGVYFEDTKINTLERDKFLVLSMFEAMAIHESDMKGEHIPHIFRAAHLKPRGKPRKKKGESDDE